MASPIRLHAEDRDTDQQTADLRYMVKQMTKGATTLWSLPELSPETQSCSAGMEKLLSLLHRREPSVPALDFYVGDFIWRWVDEEA